LEFAATNKERSRKAVQTGEEGGRYITSRWELTKVLYTGKKMFYRMKDSNNENFTESM